LGCLFSKSIAALASVLLAGSACGSGGGADAGADSDTGTQSEPDADADGDSDGDTDAACSNEFVEDSFDEAFCAGYMPEGDCVFFVDVSSGASVPDGLSWETAFPDILDGVHFARCGLLAHENCQVWVAEGRYHVYRHSRQDTVRLRAGLELYGGFAGGEAVLEERDWIVNETILDGQEPEESPCHVFHVVTGSDDAVLNGFTITGGRARMAYPDAVEYSESGGGMLIVQASPTIRNCTFAGNDSTWTGGGMHVDHGAPRVGNCLFQGNEIAGTVGFGGAALAIVGASEDPSGPEITGSVFSGNGGKELKGGAIYISQSSATIADSEFLENEAQWGAAVHSSCSNEDEPCAVTIERCRFIGNIAEHVGSAVFLEGDHEIRVRDCEFYDNHGGALTAAASAPVVQNCIFAGNQGERHGAVANWHGQVRLVNCTIFGNTATEVGGAGGVWADFDGTPCGEECPSIINSIVRGNSPIDVKDQAGAITDVTYSDIGGGWIGAGNIDADPLFANGPGWDFHLLAGSPCVDAADGSVAPALDFEGGERCDDPDSPNTGLGPPWADMGAFENVSHQGLAARAGAAGR
jgi:hypothetical protein